MWPAMQSRPDSAQSVGVLSRFLSNAGPAHVELAKYVLRYISGTLEPVITFDGNSDTHDDVTITNSVNCRII